MNLWKKLISLLMCAVLFLSVLPVANAASVTYAVQGGNLYFDTESGTVTDCDKSVTVAHIPSTINGVPVKAIGNSAFQSCSNLTSVMIPDSVTTLGRSAFGFCSALSNVSLGEGLIEIGESAFAYCSSLTSITIPRSVTTIGEYAFSFCEGMTSAIIGDGVTTIGPAAFSNCRALVDLSIGEQVRSMGYCTFFFCTSLTSVVLPTGLSCIENATFSNCTSLKHVEIPDSVTAIEESAFFECQSLENVTIPNSVKTIGAYSFYNCKSLQEVNIPEGVTSIGAYVFSECHSLDNVTIPNSVETIESYAFYKCTSLTNLFVGYGVSRIEKFAFIHCTSLQNVYYSGTETMWQEIYIGQENTPLYVATVYFKNEPDVEDPEVEEPVVNPFQDVKETDYFYEPVLWAVKHGITTGTSATTFSPEETCTRAQVVTFLWRAAESPEPVQKYNPFVDIQENDYFFKAVLWAVEKGITTGTSTSTFSPEDACTRGQVAVFLWRAQGKPAPNTTNNPFSDVESSMYYYEAVLWAVENSITNGTGDGKFSPDDSCTRGQIATFLYRAMA